MPANSQVLFGMLILYFQFDNWTFGILPIYFSWFSDISVPSTPCNQNLKSLQISSYIKVSIILSLCISQFKTVSWQASHILDGLDVYQPCDLNVLIIKPCK